MDGLVSIIMPAFNCEEYIEDSISSVIAQTYTNWELLIVDDCSTDSTVEKIKAFQDDRVKILKNDKNSGAAISRNYALREAQGKWVAFLDGDDIWHKEKLERQIKFMLSNDYLFTCTDYQVQEDGVWEPYVWTGPKKVTKRKLYDWCWFSTITVMYDREKIGLIQIADIKKNNDYAMWFKVIEKAPCYRLPECLSYYIKHDNSISSGSKLKLIKWHYRMFRIALNKNPICATLLTLNNLFYGVLKKILYKKPIMEE